MIPGSRLHRNPSAGLWSPRARCCTTARIGGGCGCSPACSSYHTYRPGGTRAPKHQSHAPLRARRCRCRCRLCVCVCVCVRVCACACAYQLFTVRDVSFADLVPLVVPEPHEVHVLLPVVGALLNHIVVRTRHRHFEVPLPVRLGKRKPVQERPVLAVFLHAPPSSERNNRRDMSDQDCLSLHV